MSVRDRADSSGVATLFAHPGYTPQMLLTAHNDLVTE